MQEDRKLSIFSGKTHVLMLDTNSEFSTLSSALSLINGGDDADVLSAAKFNRKARP